MLRPEVVGGGGGGGSGHKTTCLPTMAVTSCDLGQVGKHNVKCKMFYLKVWNSGGEGMRGAMSCFEFFFQTWSVDGAVMHHINKLRRFHVTWFNFLSLQEIQYLRDFAFETIFRSKLWVLI